MLEGEFIVTSVVVIVIVAVDVRTQKRDIYQYANP